MFTLGGKEGQSVWYVFRVCELKESVWRSTIKLNGTHVKYVVGDKLLNSIIIRYDNERVKKVKLSFLEQILV